MLENLPEPERLAVEFHSKGYRYPEIANTLGLPYETVKGWFKTRGKLCKIYSAYIQERNARLKKATGLNLSKTAENILKLDNILMTSYNAHLLGGLTRFRTRDLAAAAKIKGLILGKPMYVKVYGQNNKPLEETAAQKEIIKLNKIIKAMASVWDKTTKEAVKQEMAGMEGLII